MYALFNDTCAWLHTSHVIGKGKASVRPCVSTFQSRLDIKQSKKLSAAQISNTGVPNSMTNSSIHLNVQNFIHFFIFKNVQLTKLQFLPSNPIFASANGNLKQLFKHPSCHHWQCDLKVWVKSCPMSTWKSPKHIQCSFAQEKWEILTPF